MIDKDYEYTIIKVTSKLIIIEKRHCYDSYDKAVQILAWVVD